MRLYITKIHRFTPTQQTHLESAVFSPLQRKNYGQRNIFQLAGILAEKIILDHAYQDGNKKAALVAVDMFLKMNRYKLQRRLFSQDSIDKQIQRAHVAVAIGHWNSKDLAALYERIATPLGRITREIQSFINESKEV